MNFSEKGNKQDEVTKNYFCNLTKIHFSFPNGMIGYEGA